MALGWGGGWIQQTAWSQVLVNQAALHWGSGWDKSVLWVGQGSNLAPAWQKRLLRSLALRRSLEATDHPWFFLNLTGRAESEASDWTQPHIMSRANKRLQTSKSQVRLWCSEYRLRCGTSGKAGAGARRQCCQMAALGLQELQVSKGLFARATSKGSLWCGPGWAKRSGGLGVWLGLDTEGTSGQG